MIEGAIKKQTGATVDISEQEIIDCQTTGSFGCSGGQPGYTLLFAQSYGMMNESAYPYAAVAGACKYTAKDSRYRISGVTGCPMTNAMLAVYSYGPMGFLLDATTLQSYTGGILPQSASCSGVINHAVTMYGWGPGYYLVKNSWSTWWGESGTFKIEPGACSMNVWPTYVVTSSPMGVCTPKANPCDARTCGTVDDGCGTIVSCGVCGKLQYCNPAGACAAKGTVKDWKQVYPVGATGDFVVAKNGTVLTVTLKESTSTVLKIGRAHV